MNKILSMSIFSILLLVPVGSQNALADHGFCTSDSQCNDGNVCTLDNCTGIGPARLCTHTPTNIGVACNDGDGNVCTTGFCGIAGNCAGIPVTDGRACGDQSDTACSEPNTCSSIGTCLPNNTPGISCEDGDGNACTGICGALGSCTSAPDPTTAGNACGDQSDTACSDPNICSSIGTCLPNNTPLIPCENNDGDACTGTCGFLGECTDLPGPALAGVACGDQTVTECSEANTCSSIGTCLPNNTPGTFCVNDGDSNVCTGVCGLLGECTTVPKVGASCDDNNACSSGDTCIVNPFYPADPTEGICEGIPNPNALGNLCNDGDSCTGPDTCNVIGVCVSGPPVNIPACFPENGNGGNDVMVAGEIIPTESTSLILSGMQTNLSWIIPAIVIAAGASAFLIRRQSND